MITETITYIVSDKKFKSKEEAEEYDKFKPSLGELNDFIGASYICSSYKSEHYDYKRSIVFDNMYRYIKILETVGVYVEVNNGTD